MMAVMVKESVHSDGDGDGGGPMVVIGGYES